jgi:hypothetical protein
LGFRVAGAFGAPTLHPEIDAKAAAMAMQTDERVLMVGSMDDAGLVMKKLATAARTQGVSPLCLVMDTQKNCRLSLV